MDLNNVPVWFKFTNLRFVHAVKLHEALIISKYVMHLVYYINLDLDWIYKEFSRVKLQFN